MVIFLFSELYCRIFSTKKIASYFDKKSGGGEKKKSDKDNKMGNIENEGNVDFTQLIA